MLTRTVVATLADKEVGRYTFTFSEHQATPPKRKLIALAKDIMLAEGMSEVTVAVVTFRIEGI